MRTGNRPLVIVETHPVQYHAPVYRLVEEAHGIPVTVIYGSDFSVAGYCDKEFNASFSWDVDLTAGNDVRFLSRAKEGGAQSFDEVSPHGLSRMLREVKGSAILLTGYSRLFNIGAFYAARKTGLPVLFRAETADHAARRDSVKSTARDWTLRRLYSLCARVLPIGSNSYAHYRRLGVSEEKMIFAPYCVNTAPFRCSEADRGSMRPATRAEVGLEDNEVAILFSGKLSERKGVHILTAAAKLLPPELRSRVVLVFLGSGPEQALLTESCRSQPGVRALFPGFRNQTQLSPWYHAADMLVLPSLRFETWGLVVNEALHHGVPCVVSDAVGCAPDLIAEGRTGAIAGAGSPESLAAAIIRTAGRLSDTAARLDCRTKVSDFSILKAADGIARAWREVAASAPEMALRKSFA
jgi:glycosyltransferase involved in cell wall biosynthesis